MAGDVRIQGFNADAVRAGLRLAMQVGLPTVTGDQPTFYMPRTWTATETVDAEGVPFDPAYRPTYARLAAVKVPCAIEYHDAEGKMTGFGEVAPSRIVLTLLDQDFAQVDGFEYVVVRGVSYSYHHMETPKGLVTVGLFRVHCQAVDEA
jgi:hypothetical protein